ncbi:MAG: hypothetical protein WDO14_24235 [Bacteroidota bacterium]
MIFVNRRHRRHTHVLAQKPSKEDPTAGAREGKLIGIMEEIIDTKDSIIDKLKI